MRFSLLFILLWSLNACTPRLIAAPEPTPIMATAEPQEDRIVSLVVDDLSSRLLLDPKQVRVLSIESTLWSDTALGCPRPGEVYAQQTVPGYRLRLEAAGTEYVYHTDMDTTIILCTEDEMPSFPVTPGEIDDGQPWVPVN